MPDAAWESRIEDFCREQERAAQEWLLQREHCNDLRGQLQAAVDLLVERTGLSRDDVSQQLAAKVAENRVRNHETSNIGGDPDGCGTGP